MPNKMTDPAFAETETEAEATNSRLNYRSQTADKRNGYSGIQDGQPETSPLLGPSVLSDQPQKRWYNRPSVCSYRTNLADQTRYSGFCQRLC